ncbi:MAG: alpha/beta hydrolase [Bacteroidota bacterium]
MPSFFSPRIKTIIKVALLAYALIGIAGYYLQDQLLLHPVTIPSGNSYQINQPYQEIQLPVDSTTSFHFIQFVPPDDTITKGVVLYFHGNRENINRYARFAPAFMKENYEVWMADYPGFGKAKGKATEALMYEEAKQLYLLARKKYEPEQIIIYGKSIGTGVASWLASVRYCRHLVLETPYYSIPSLLQPIFGIYPLKRLLHFQFPTYSYLPAVKAPITILHGTSDGVIRISNARKLTPLLKPGDQFIMIEGGSHNNLSDYPLFQNTIAEILRK